MAETEFGIEEYVGGKIESVHCILKQMYSDFVVQEISEDKKIASIRSQEKDVEEPVAENQNNEFKGEVPECLTSDILNEFQNFEEKLKTTATETFSIDAENLNKEQRTSIHKYIREKYKGTLESQLCDNKIIVKAARNSDRKRKHWDENLGDHLHFTLAKGNKDTSYALGLVAKFAGLKPNIFRTCGIKDKRAMTSQRVSCYRVEKNRLKNLNKRLRDIFLFDFEYKSEGLKMGGHWGNRFNIVLREIASKEILSKQCEIFKDIGFINYFGTQRFGSFVGNTPETGKLIVQRKWEEALKNVMKTAKAMGNSTAAIGASHFLETGDPVEALKKLKGGQSFASTESLMLNALAKGKTWQQCFTEALPTNMRSLYVHAYQSLIWNKLVTRRIREFGSGPIAGDVDKDGNILTDHKITDAFMPLPGSSLEMFPEYAKLWLEELLKVDGLTNDSFFPLRDRFALGDTSRQMIVMPEDVNFEFIHYENSRQILQMGIEGENAAVMQEDSPKPYLALKIAFSLPNGCYATVALRQVTGFDMGKDNMAQLGKEIMKSVIERKVVEEASEVTDAE